jgi:hypothetical protein
MATPRRFGQQMPQASSGDIKNNSINLDKKSEPVPHTPKAATTILTPTAKRPGEKGERSDHEETIRFLAPWAGPEK